MNRTNSVDAKDEPGDCPKKSFSRGYDEKLKRRKIEVIGHSVLHVLWISALVQVSPK